MCRYMCVDTRVISLCVCMWMVMSVWGEYCPVSSTESESVQWLVIRGQSETVHDLIQTTYGRPRKSVESVRY